MARGATALLTRNDFKKFSCYPKTDLNGFEKVKMIQKKGAASQHRGGDFHLLDATPRKSKKIKALK